MSKHTSGPWSANGWRVCASVDDPEKFSYICDTATNEQSRTPRNAANARLIAAAPELLEYLKRAINCNSDFGELTHEIVALIERIKSDD